MKCALLLVLTLGCSAASAAQAPARDTVKVRAGLVAGERVRTLRVFRGIPYAAPPVDSLRWRAPQPVQPWNGVRQATTFGPACMQPRAPGSTAWRNMSEDCLTLNVWTPSTVNSTRLPVMVLLPGGGFMAGGSAEPMWQCDALAARGVVVVSLNYRLNVFGFFAHPALSTEVGHAASGNFGLLDQIAALTWVKQNIAAFGGDSANVTLFGNSAGGSSVLYLMVSPLARGLFARAIAQSAANIYAPFSYRAKSHYGRPSAEQVGASLGADITTLRALPAAELMRKAAVRTDLMFDETGNEFWPFVDGTLLPDEPSTLFDAGKFARVPLIIGSNSEEGSVFVAASTGLPRMTDSATWAGFLARKQQGADSLVAASYAVGRVADIPAAANRWVNDWTFHGSARAVARAIAERGVAVFVYNFTHAPPIEPFRSRKLGAYHSGEIRYTFGSLLDSSERPAPFDARDSTLAEIMSTAWLRFAAIGNPDVPGRLAWPRYRPSTDQHVEFGDSIRVSRGLRKSSLDQVDRALTQMRLTDARRKR